jgi:hypothetical protein
VGVALVVVAAEDGVEVFGGGDVVGDVRVVVEGDAAVGDVEFREVAVEFDVRVLCGNAAEEEGVAVVVAEDDVDGAVEAGGEGGEGEGGAEVAEEAEVFSAFLLDGDEDPLEVGELVVGVAEDGDFHAERSADGGVDAVDIAVVVEGLEEGGDFLALGVGEFRVVLGAVAEFGGGDGPAAGFECLGDVVEFGGLGEEAGGDGVGREVFEIVGGEDFEVIGAGFDGGAFGVGAFRGVCFDETDVVEHPCDGAHGAGAGRGRGFRGRCGYCFR